MQVILDSSFARPGSAPIWGGKKGEFRDWTSFVGARSRCDSNVTNIKAVFFLTFFIYLLRILLVSVVSFRPFRFGLFGGFGGFVSVVSCRFGGFV